VRRPTNCCSYMPRLFPSLKTTNRFIPGLYIPEVNL
jgi:hypothetical protein